MTTVPQASPYSKNNPFPATLRENRLLSKAGSSKETRHFVVDLRGSGLAYTCGDSLGVQPANAPEAVEAILRALRARADAAVVPPKESVPVALGELLAKRYSLAGPTPRFLKAMLEKAIDPDERKRLEALVAPEAAATTTEYLANREFVDLLEEFPGVRFTPEEFVGQLRKLNPRLYSIASSPTVFPEEIHLTVAIVRYQTNGRKRVGVCSSYLADRVKAGKDTFPVFVASSHFRLPEDPATDVIMVGPGTGIAPFRSFMQERVATGAKGRNWVFFGDQKQACDFLYEEDFRTWKARGALARLDCAWSRDQAHKVYVQDRMRENGAELWRWLQGGASFYVCGDAKRMAHDVDQALVEIGVKHGGMTPEASAEYFKALKKDKRYQRDVY